MKQIVARILNTANQLDDSGLYAEANVLTRIAQEIPYAPDMNEELFAFLNTITRMDTSKPEIVIYVKREAERLIKDMSEIMGRDYDDGEGPTDEQLFGQAEDYSLHQGRMDQELQDAGRTPYPY